MCRSGDAKEKGRGGGKMVLWGKGGGENEVIKQAGRQERRREVEAGSGNTITEAHHQCLASDPFTNTNGRAIRDP